MAPKPDPTRVVAIRKAARETVNKIFDKAKIITTNNDYSNEQKIHLLERKLQDLDDNLQNISAMDEQIASTLDPNDLPNELADTIDVTFNNKDLKDEFDFELERLKKVLAAEKAPNPNPNPNPDPDPDPDPPRRAAKRPDINLPVFDGDILNWPSFWQAFDNEINSDPRTPAITKYTYLLGQLAPKVANNIRGLTPSAANYPKLVTYLTERYGRPNLIINKYMRTLYSLPKPENRAGLQSFHDTLEMCIGGLDSLGKTADMYGDLLVVILLDKFPDNIYENLSRRHDGDEWTLDQLRTALTNELRLFEERPSLQMTQPATSTTLFVDASSRPVKPKICHFCAGSHAPSNCTVHASPDERSKIATKKGLCLNCLASGHRKSECTSRFRCRVCKAAHHTSLHDNKRTKEATDTSATKVTAAVLSVSTPESAVVAAAMLQQASSPFVFLKTAIARVRSECKSTLANIVFDDAAQRSFITSKLASMLGLKPVAVEHLILSGIKAKPFGPGLYNLTRVGIIDRLGNTVTILAVILEEIVAPLDEKPRKALTTLNYLKGLPLAHPVSNEERFAVDLLIGGNFYWHFMIDEIPIRGPGPVATNSRLGYLISGSLTELSVEEYNHSTILTVITGEESDLERLWSLEAFGIFGEGKFGQEARDYVQQSIEYRNDKYVAKFPWKVDHPSLPSNYNIVRNMTRATIRKLAKKPELLSLFDRLIRHQLDNGFIEKVPDSDLNKRCHYIPYHYVTKDSSTTPIRIVYNCSQKVGTE
jgi:hypothetical protein